MRQMYLIENVARDAHLQGVKGKRHASPNIFNRIDKKRLFAAKTEACSTLSTARSDYSSLGVTRGMFVRLTSLVLMTTRETRSRPDRKNTAPAPCILVVLHHGTGMRPVPGGAFGHAIVAGT
jgi:hypothetical protein